MTKSDNIDGAAIKRILEDQSFVSLTTDMADRLTRKVMATGTAEEDRTEALTEHHALQRLLAAMRTQAQQAEKD